MTLNVLPASCRQKKLGSADETLDMWVVGMARLRRPRPRNSGSE